MPDTFTTEIRNFLLWLSVFLGNVKQPADYKKANARKGESYKCVLLSITILTNDISLDDITKDDIQDAPQNRKYLPLTESTAYTLLALVEPLHGYGVMQKVEAMRQGTVKIGPGTLYGAFTTLESEGLIVKVDESDRRKTYALTDKGKAVIKEHIRRTAIMVENGKMTQSW